MEVVGAAGFEPTTPGFGGRCSIQMSYVPGECRFIARAPDGRKQASKMSTGAPGLWRIHRGDTLRMSTA